MVMTDICISEEKNQCILIMETWGLVTSVVVILIFISDVHRGEKMVTNEQHWQPQRQ